MFKKLLFGIPAAIIVIIAGAYAAFQLSPWPSVWLIRNSIDERAAAASASVIGLVPTNISAKRGLNYAPGDRDALLDVYAPAESPGLLPAVVWVHGGGFISGSRSDLSGYLQILAAHGFVTIGVDYTTAPEARFPTPVRQTNEALAYVSANAERFKIDPGRIFLAGDSAGAQIVAQSALVITDPEYARRLNIDPGLSRNALRGVLLFCGPYEPSTMNFDGPLGRFMRTVIWSYVGTRDPRDGRVAQISVEPHITSGYPPAFISAGNADPLAPQSVALADALRAKGIEVDALFFSEDHQPPLDHEYQFLLSTQAGQLALDRSVAFLKAHAGAITGEQIE